MTTGGTGKPKEDVRGAESTGSQVARLGRFILSEFSGEAILDDGAVDTAIRIMREQKRLRDSLDSSLIPEKELPGRLRESSVQSRSVRDGYYPISLHCSNCSHRWTIDVQKGWYFHHRWGGTVKKDAPAVVNEKNSNDDWEFVHCPVCATTQGVNRDVPPVPSQPDCSRCPGLGLLTSHRWAGPTEEQEVEITSTGTCECCKGTGRILSPQHGDYEMDCPECSGSGQIITKNKMKMNVPLLRNISIGAAFVPTTMTPKEADADA